MSHNADLTCYKSIKAIKSKLRRKKVILYERFVEECYEFGDGYLGEKGITCFYGRG